MTDPAAHLDVTDDDGVRVITWTRPDALNAMSIEMWHGTRDALDSADADGIRCIVLTGQGRAFTVGQDLGEFGDPRHAEPDGGFRGLMRALAEVPVPLVAAVNGMGVGFGLTVLPWCEIVLVSPEARLKAPFVGLGVVTEAAASVSLPEIMGPQAAAKHLLTGEWIDAEAAVRHGLAFELVPAGRADGPGPRHGAHDRRTSHRRPCARPWRSCASVGARAGARRSSVSTTRWRCSPAARRTSRPSPGSSSG